MTEGLREARWGGTKFITTFIEILINETLSKAEGSLTRRNAGLFIIFKLTLYSAISMVSLTRSLPWQPQFKYELFHILHITSMVSLTKLLGAYGIGSGKLKKNDTIDC